MPKYPKCTKCRKPNPTPDACRCPACVEHGKRDVKQRREKRTKAGLCIDCAEPSGGTKRCRKCLDKANETSKEYCIQTKIEVMEHYGGPRCACCGEDHLIMLSLDHVDQNGAADRKENGKSGTGFYLRLRKLGYPPGFRVLCRNCNYAVYFSPNHVCPHRTGCFTCSNSEPLQPEHRPEVFPELIRS